MKKHLTLLVFGFLFFSGSIYSQSWNWEVGKGGNNGRYGLADCVLGPLSTDDAWEIDVAYSISSYQAYTNGDTVFVRRMHNMNDYLHGSKIYAYNILNGDLIWEVEVPVDFPETDYMTSIFGMNDSMVFAGRSRGTISPTYLYALDIDDGSIIWKSESLITVNGDDFIYADNGDLLIGNMGTVRRVNVIDGTTVWETERWAATSTGAELVLYNDHVYGWEASDGTGPRISVFDVNTGEYLYSSRRIGGGLVQQIAPIVGPDGTVYAPRAQNNPITDTLVAFNDTGTELKESWSLPMGWVPIGTHGIGPDGSFYMYSRDFEIFRISPDKGIMASTSINYNPELETSTLIKLNNMTASIVAPESGIVTINYYKNRNDMVPTDTSFIIKDNETAACFPKIAIDSDAYLYVSNGQNSVFCFDYELNMIWSDNIPNIGSSGFALAKNGNLALATKGNTINVYPGRGVCETFPVTFYVHGQYNNPLEGAVVNIDDESVITDENGEAVFDLEEGEISYHVLYQEYEISGDYLVSSEPNQMIDVGLVITSLLENENGIGNIYPNPSSGITNINYTLKSTSNVHIMITDIYGKQIEVIANELKDAGHYTSIWNANGLENGTYLVRIAVNNLIDIRRIVLIN